MRRLGLLSCQSAQRTAGAARLGVHGGGSAAEQRGDHHEQRDARSTGFRQFEDGLDVGHLVVGGAVLGRETPGVGAGEGDVAVFLDGHGERGLEVLVSVGDRGLGHGVAAGLQSVELDDAVGTGRDFERVLIAVRQHAVLAFATLSVNFAPLTASPWALTFVNLKPKILVRVSVPGMGVPAGQPFMAL